MTHKLTARSGWLAGAIGGAALMFTVMAFDFTPPAHSAVTPATVSTGSFADVVEAVSPAVVNIMVDKVTEAQPSQFSFQGDSDDQPNVDPRYRSPFDEFFGRFFGGPGYQFQVPQRRIEGQGSGFLIAEDGYIVTNNHVIDGADKIVVTMQDGKKLDAKLVGADPKTDLALVKVDGSSFPHVAFGDSDHARVGDWVLAIGNPFGLGGTASAGIISARGRDIQSGPYDDYLQIDAPINPGNSGGPVFNTAGEVVGINTAIFSPNGGNVGIGFAIPSNQAKSVIKSLGENGSVQRGWLGVQIQNVDEEIAKSLRLEGTEGALVADVVEDGPAAHAGVQQGDVITKFNGETVDSSRTLSRLVAAAAPNKPAKVTVWRDGRSRELSVDLGEAAQDEAVAANDTRGGGSAQAAAAAGLRLRPLTADDRAALGLPSSVTGAIVASVEPGSAAAEKGIRPGDVITRVNNKAVENVADTVAALNSARERNET
ncbi:MAG TPA: Do family serine endopeptidase, partial [Gammaproteobacteria bacterium]|nr:Do family serine endopeptidase [Gammaproteobacteria bacterium]